MIIINIASAGNNRVYIIHSSAVCIPTIMTYTYIIYVYINSTECTAPVPNRNDRVRIINKKKYEKKMKNFHERRPRGLLPRRGQKTAIINYHIYDTDILIFIVLSDRGRGLISIYRCRLTLKSSYIFEHENRRCNRRNEDT